MSAVALGVGPMDHFVGLFASAGYVELDMDSAILVGCFPLRGARSEES